MRNLEELKGIDRYHELIIYRVFNSRKNTVAEARLNKDKRGVIKLFNRRESMEREYSILSNTTGVSTPKVYSRDDENIILVLEFIDGENLCDVVNNPSVSFNEKKKLVALLGEWLARFHEEFNMRRGDSILRNFIVNDRIWGVDFEESTVEGKIIEDVAEACISILMTKPMFTDEKKKLCIELLEAYSMYTPLDLENVDRVIEEKYLEVVERREKLLKNGERKLVDEIQIKNIIDLKKFFC